MMKKRGVEPHGNFLSGTAPELPMILLSCCFHVGKNASIFRAREIPAVVGPLS